jgi:sortase A
MILAGAVGVLHALYIPLKAELAQWLIASVWLARDTDDGAARPWPWADTRPVARIAQPRLGVEQFVLEGASGRNLAFGPTHVDGTAYPQQRGNVVLSGHRDTHFAWLEELRVDDQVIVEGLDGSVRKYRVATIGIHHETETHLLDHLAGDQLRLITCYPFRAIDSGTSLRYVITALPRS